MKKLLIIQLDDTYFLFETIGVLEKHGHSLKDFQVTLLATEEHLKKLRTAPDTATTRISCNKQEILNQKFDISVNLSLNEESWVLHNQINAPVKIGPYLNSNQLLVKDLWSSYYLTHKARTPFLTFHLQQIFQNIIGIKSIKTATNSKNNIKQIAFSPTNINLFSGHEQEKLIQLICTHFPSIEISDISEIDPISDLSHTLYIGPAKLEANEICDYGAKGVFWASHFQGFNLLPSQGGNYFLSSRGNIIHAEDVFSVVKSVISNQKINSDNPLSIYCIEEENLFGGYLHAQNKSDDNYPFYQAHVVLWNYLLNLFDTNLNITHCSESQIKLLKQQQEILKKIIRLYDYATSAISMILNESKSHNSSGTKISESMNQLSEIEQLTDQVAQTNSLIRPLLDYYRIRRGQNDGANLITQAQHSFLLYSEEHQALKALEELFSVTLQKNEVSI